MTSTYEFRHDATAEIAEDAWEQTGYPDDTTARLLCAIEINGVSMHLEAIAVHEDREGIVRADDDSFDDDIEHIAAANGAGGFQTLNIKGREYVLWACPFS